MRLRRPIERVLRVSEASVQRAIMEYLTLHGWIVFSFAAGGTHKALRGSVPQGWPDLLALKDGRYVHLEVKAPGGKLTAGQLAMHERLRDAGATVLMARGIEDLYEMMGGNMKENEND